MTRSTTFGIDPELTRRMPERLRYILDASKRDSLQVKSI
jgi:hypothetical protein